MKVSVNLFRRIRKEFVLYPVALLLIIGLYTEVNGDAFTNELDEYLTASHEVWKFHGAALVAKDGKVLFKKGYGMASLELGVPSAPQMKYLIGSITKQFTAVAILQLEEKGRLSLEDPITKFLPDYPKETGDRVTIHHLLRHTSGVPSYTDNPEAMGLRTTPTTLEALIALFEDLPLDFEPGEKYEYSNSGYVLLGAVIEAVSGMTYEEYIKANIFDVVGMTNSKTLMSSICPGLMPPAGYTRR
jgi:CubicO group peptidase (beta-lactamase class C family)